MNNNIADIRRDYSHKSLSEKDVNASPIKQFENWWNEAVNSKIDEVNAMTLATASIDALESGWTHASARLECSLTIRTNGQRLRTTSTILADVP